MRADSTGRTLYLGNTELHAATLTSSATATRYYSAGGTIAVRTTTGGLTWMASDHHGTGQAAIDAATLAVTRKRTDPYGSVRGTIPNWPSQRGFVDGVNDPDTGYVHIGARQYNPATGRFLSPDPVFDVRDPQSWHGYAYGGNAPVTSSDPSGLVRNPEGGGSGGGWTPPYMPPAPTPPAPLPIFYGGGTELTFDPPTPEEPDTTFYINGVGFAFGKTRVYQLARQFDEHIQANGLNLAEMDPLHILTILYQVCITGDTGCSQELGASMRDAHDELRKQKTEGSGSWWDVAAAALAGGITPCTGTSTRFCGAKPKSVKTMKLKSGPCSQSCGCRDSFAPDTLILMADGSVKPIAAIAVGDKVLATDPETGETAAREVTQLHLNLDSDLTDLTIHGEHGSEPLIATTQEHPFWNATTGSWTGAGSLKPGDRLLTAGNGEVTVTQTANFTGGRWMHNLTVSELHTYYVLAGSTPVLVHNAGCDEWAAKFASKNGGEIQTFHGPGGQNLPMGPYRPKGPGTPVLDEPWFHHTVVVRGGKVYDQWHTEGIKISDYKKRFDYWEDMEFGF
ncbi:polymorphic toxin-type HINT domain-containing protein [Longispora albida]|uniref:polymorphic toxin-type HINT domain-containing protein n=1 Tax=Longispora albida TaxID=203523 RepID=UPI0006845E5B|nr:polymorphic toxin-type HINT domain-containing protein [Longispora albida]